MSRSGMLRAGGYQSGICTTSSANSKSAAQGQRFCEENQEGLQRRFDLKPPGLEQRLRDILGILVTPRPLPKTGGPDILVRGQLELLHNLLEGGYSRHNRADGLRLAPVRISTTLCHRFCVLSKWVNLSAHPQIADGGVQSVQRNQHPSILSNFHPKINRKIRLSHKIV